MTTREGREAGAPGDHGRGPATGRVVARWRRWAGALPLAGALFLGDPGGCEEATPADLAAANTEATPAVSSRLTLEAGGRVTYELAWDWSGTTQDETTGARSWTTALGYELTLEELATAATSMALVPCDETATRPSLGVFTPRLARADHTYVYDTTLVTTALAETSRRDTPEVFGQGVSPGQTYCQLHALWGPVAAETRDGLRLQGWSAYLRGSHRRGEGERRPFEAFVSLGQGALRSLQAEVTNNPSAADPAGADGVSGNATGVRVTLTRHVVLALDPLDFDALSPAELAFEALGRLGVTATTRVRGPG